MKKSKKGIARRSFFAAAAGAAGLAAALPRSLKAADAQPTTDKEKANIKLVHDFFDAWSPKTADPQKLVDFLTDDCMTKQGGTDMIVTGKDANLEQFKKMTARWNGMKLIYDEDYARGPIVVQYRRDIFPTPDRQERTIYVVSLLVIKDGKIRQWFDFGGPKPGTDKG
jgi:hypothetical protein